MTEKGPSELETAQSLADRERVGLAVELWDFVKHNKKYWLLPILIIILGMGLLVLLSGSAAAPFIYTLF